jgi:DNA-binding MarR family transcriptional regulator
MHRASFHGFRGDGVHNPHRGQGRVLAILRMKPEISQRELAYLLDMSKQSLAELLAKLEKSGYVTRRSSEEDKRVMTIKLTDEGAKAAEDMDDSVSDATKILDCLNDDELNAFSDYLSRIIKSHEEQFPDGDYEERRRHREMFMSRHGHGFEGCGGHGGHPHRFEGCSGRDRHPHAFHPCANPHARDHFYRAQQEG